MTLNTALGKQPTTPELAPEFFSRPTLEVARDLLGYRLCTFRRGQITSGIIVEVEAYHGPTDEASHAFRGQSKRNEVMFRAGGLCYVYLIYGLHYCVNVVTEDVGIGAAVLIRALEPDQGTTIMARRRGAKDLRFLTNGPARLCQALGIGPTHNGENLIDSEKIWLEPAKRFGDEEIIASTRIGISKAAHLEWRYYVRGNKFVSK